MKDHGRMRSAIALLSSLCSLVLAVPGEAHATTAPGGGSASYQCKDRSDTQAASTPVTFSLISPPSSVRPGDTLALSGNLGIALSAADRQRSQLLLTNTASIAATDFDLVVRFAGKEVDLKPTSVISTATRISSPTLTADVSYPDLVIPSSATGSVSVAMPSASDTAVTIAGAPTAVTFTFQLKQDSPLMAKRDFGCWTEEDPGAGATVARIAVATVGGGPAADPVSPSTAPVPADTSDTPPPPPQATGTPLGMGGPPLLPSAAPPPDLASGSPVGTTPPPASTPELGSPAPTLTSAPIPAATVSDRTFVPGWILALFIAVFPGAAIAYAVVQRRRLKAATRAAVR